MSGFDRMSRDIERRNREFETKLRRSEQETRRREREREREERREATHGSVWVDANHLTDDEIDEIYDRHGRKGLQIQLTRDIVEMRRRWYGSYKEYTYNDEADNLHMRAYYALCIQLMDQEIDRRKHGGRGARRSDYPRRSTESPGHASERSEASHSARSTASSSPVVTALTKRRQGTVRFWNREKGFGFISVDYPGADVPTDVYVHRSGLISGQTDLDENGRVQFLIGTTSKGPRAVNVVRLIPTASPASPIAKGRQSVEPTHEQDEIPGPHAQQHDWEYCAVDLPEPHEQKTFLDDLGEYGWELVQVMIQPESPNKLKAFLRKPAV